MNISVGQILQCCMEHQDIDAYCPKFFIINFPNENLTPKFDFGTSEKSSSRNVN